MENNERPICPKCKKELIKDIKRSGGRQKWKCNNKDCHYYETEGAKINKLKINAINFFIDFLYNSRDEANAEMSRNIKLNFRKTKFENKDDPELKFKEITDIRRIHKLDCSKCFIVQLNDDSVDLISMKYADSEVSFENSNPNTTRIYNIKINSKNNNF